MALALISMSIRIFPIICTLVANNGMWKDITELNGISFISSHMRFLITLSPKHMMSGTLQRNHSAGQFRVSLSVALSVALSVSTCEQLWVGWVGRGVAWIQDTSTETKKFKILPDLKTSKRVFFPFPIKVWINFTVISWIWPLELILEIWVELIRDLALTWLLFHKLIEKKSVN